MASLCPSAAPGNVSALMSGVMIKTAIFMLIRVSFDFLGASQAWWGYIVLTIGTISAILGILYAVVEPDMKRMLAFSSIENIGIILIGLGASIIFFASAKPILCAIAMIAALYHLLNHSVFKGLLFMGQVPYYIQPIQKISRNWGSDQENAGMRHSYTNWRIVNFGHAVI